MFHALYNRRLPWRAGAAEEEKSIAFAIQKDKATVIQNRLRGGSGAQIAGLRRTLVSALDPSDGIHATGDFHNSPTAFIPSKVRTRVWFKLIMPSCYNVPHLFSGRI